MDPEERCDGCEEDCESVMSTAEFPENRHLCPTCYSNWEAEFPENRTATCDSDDDEEDEEDEEDEPTLCEECGKVREDDTPPTCEWFSLLPKPLFLCRTCYEKHEDEEIAKNRTATCDSDDEGEDLKCAECRGTIVYNSPAHDNALTHDGTRWWCLGCSAAWEKALKEDE